MIQPVITRKPKFVVNPQRSPTLGFGLDTPVLDFSSSSLSPFCFIPIIRCITLTIQS